MLVVFLEFLLLRSSFFDIVAFIMQSKACTPLSIIVIGGGIGGLAASILLAQSGHSVHVLERKDASFESRSTGGISLFHNSTRIIQDMGLNNKLANIADEGQSRLGIKYSTGEVFETLPRTYSQVPPWLTTIGV